jgi:F-box/leucine-rich repeat protein 16
MFGCNVVCELGLQALFELELAGCNEVTEAGLWACLTPRIVSLTLTDCINVADEAVGAVAQLLPSLYEFSLQAYHVTDAALGYFSPKQSNSLSILRLQSCWELTNHGVVNIGGYTHLSACYTLSVLQSQIMRI